MGRRRAFAGRDRARRHWRACRAEHRGAGAGDTERAVHQRLGPGGDVRRQCQNDRRGVRLRRGLERLRTDQHADIQKDRRDATTGTMASNSEMIPNHDSTITMTPTAAE